MKIHLQNSEGANIIRGYSPDRVIINQETYTRSLIVLPQRIIRDWPPRLFTELAPEHFALIMELEPEVVLLGTGRRLQFPKPSLTSVLVEAQIGIEVMDTAAACRTYNILMGEGRNVAAALLIEN
ncbi:MAG TPA: Mth938-like domain-containing protein [Acidiferrobacterales bacterium]|nr:Mth938-like domain-containing protein [Acidiferrobacterales bacterium]